MVAEELKKGLENIEEEDSQGGSPLEGGAPPEGAGDASEWAPSMDWLMGSLGPFFNNNQGIGELLLDKLKESGVNTEGVALAGLVNVLQQFSQEYKALSEAIGDNLDRINELSDQNDNLAQAIQDVIKEMNLTTEDGGAPPMDTSALAGAGDLGAGAPMDAGAGDMSAGASMDAGAGDMGAGAPMDTGAGDLGAGAPMDAGAGGMGAGAPMDTGAGAPLPPDQAITSDTRMKIISDYRMKRQKRQEAKGFHISDGILSACRERLQGGNT